MIFQTTKSFSASDVKQQIHIQDEIIKPQIHVQHESLKQQMHI
jgi:hypothetical protein